MDMTQWLNWLNESACMLLCCVYSGQTNKERAQPDSLVNKCIKVLLYTAQPTTGTVSSVQLSCSVVSNSLWPQGLHQHTRPPCPSPNPEVYSNSSPMSCWCHPTISSSIIPFSSHLQTFLASGSFQMSQLFTSGGQNIGVSASTSVLPMNTQDWYPLRWTGWISLQSKGLSRVFSKTTVQKHSILQHSAFLMAPLSHPYVTIAFTRRTFVGKVMSLLFNMLSRLVITFLPRSKRLLSTWLQSPSAVILEPKKINSATVSTVSPSICHEEWWDRMPWS